FREKINDSKKQLFEIKSAKISSDHQLTIFKRPIQSRHEIHKNYTHLDIQNETQLIYVVSNDEKEEEEEEDKSFELNRQLQLSTQKYLIGISSVSAGTALVLITFIVPILVIIRRSDERRLQRPLNRRRSRINSLQLQHLRIHEFL
ncbi:unnamed protein product, partial [Didymodactylos carnosus]